MITSVVVFGNFFLWSPVSKDIVYRKNGIGVRVEQQLAASPDHESDRWGYGESPASFIVRRMIVIVDGRTWVTFRSAYSDLANVCGIRAYRQKQEVHVTLDGGDAGASFSAKFVYRGGYLQSRKVADGEFPREHSERTVYTSLVPTG